MNVIIKTKAFLDEKCTCNCGNTHELYGGKGYETFSCQGYDDRDGGLYLHQMKCNVCGEIHTFKF